MPRRHRTSQSSTGSIGIGVELTDAADIPQVWADRDEIGRVELDLRAVDYRGA